MLSAFTATLHVPNLSKPDHVLAVLEESDLFTKKELQTLSKRMMGHKYGSQYISIKMCKNINPNFNNIFQSFHWHQEIA